MTSKFLKRPQMISNDPEVKSVKCKNKLKSGADIEITDEYLDEVLQNNNF